MSGETEREPIFNAPGVILVTSVVLIAIQAVMSYLSDDVAYNYALMLGLVPARYADVDVLIPGGALAAYISPFTHMLLHGDWLHALFNVAWFAAFGTMLARRMSAIRFLAFAIVSGLGGALAFAIFNWGLATPMIGASGAIAGLFGGMLRVLAVVRPLRDPQERSVALLYYPIPALRYCLTDRLVLALLGMFIGLNLLSGTPFFEAMAGGSIAYEAHLGGLATGFFLAPFFDPQRQMPGWLTPTPSA
ncbi:MAG: rhomboid family intramembrane serine protease [Pseudomonadota bacterium]